MRYGIAEILEIAGQQPNDDAKVAVLKEHESAALFYTLRFTYHPDITWLLPEGDAPYTPCKVDYNIMGRFYSEVIKLDKFLAINGVPQRNLTNQKRELLFVSILESILPKDAVLLNSMKDKKLPWAVSPDVVRKAFPGCIPEDA